MCLLSQQTLSNIESGYREPTDGQVGRQGLQNVDMIDISVHAIRSEARRQGVSLGGLDKHGVNALWDELARLGPDTIAAMYYMGAPEWAADRVINRVLREVTNGR